MDLTSYCTLLFLKILLLSLSFSTLMFFAFLKLLSFFIDGLDFLLNLTNLCSIDPYITSFLIRQILPKSYLIVRDSDSNFISFHLMKLDNMLQHIFFHLVFESLKALLLDFKFLFQSFILLSQFLCWIIALTREPEVRRRTWR